MASRDLRLLSEIEELDEKRITEGTYGAVRFSPETNAKLKKFVEDNGIPEPNDDLHTTTIYSRKKISFNALGEFKTPIKVSPKSYSFDLFGEDKDTLVLKFKSDFLKMRWQIAMDLGATYDFPEYKPHVSLSYKVPKDFDLSSLPLPDFALEIVEEYTKELSDD